MEILLLSGGSGQRSMADVLSLQLSVAAVPPGQVLEGSGRCLNECEPEVDIELLVLVREVFLN